MASSLNGKFKKFVIVWIVIFSAFTIWGQVQNRTSAQNNKDRIADIQASRVISCKDTYESIRQVFKPFFPPKKQQTPKTREQLARFNRIIDKHKAQCVMQTLPPGTPAPTTTISGHKKST